MRILLVDDNINLGKLYKHWLEREGYDVVLTHQGSEATTLLHDGADVLVSHLDRKAECGVAMAQALRHQSPELTMYFCAGENPSADVVCKAHGLGKVFSSDGRPIELLRALRKLAEPPAPSRVQRATEQVPTRPDVASRRVAARTKLALGMKLRFSDVNDVLVAKSVNISLQGLLIKTASTPDVGTPIHIQVHIDTRVTSLHGKVVRVFNGHVAVELTRWPDSWAALCEQVQGARQERLSRLLSS